MCHGYTLTKDTMDAQTFSSWTAVSPRCEQASRGAGIQLQQNKVKASDAGFTSSVMARGLAVAWVKLAIILVKNVLFMSEDIAASKFDLWGT